MFRHPSSARREHFLRYPSCGRGTSVVWHDELWTAVRTHLKTRTRGATQAFCFIALWIWFSVPCFCFLFVRHATAPCALVQYDSVLRRSDFFQSMVVPGRSRSRSTSRVPDGCQVQVFFRLAMIAIGLICIILASVLCLRSIFCFCRSSIMNEYTGLGPEG